MRVLNFGMKWAHQAFNFRGLWIPVALAFLFVSLSRIDDGGTNSMARFATLRAMSDDLTFRIDKNFDWTQDWARTPDGHYYSNKAPGPTLIAFPVFWVIDKALYKSQEQHLDSKGRRQAPRGIHKVAISTIFQVLPFLLFSLLLLHSAFPKGMSHTAYFFTLLAILFGNTAAVLMSSYMGNPFSGMAMIALAYFYFERKIALMSFCFGWVVLSDYGNAALVLPFLFLLLPDVRTEGLAKVSKEVFIGALIPGFLWCWYHTACFGDPLSLPYKYEVDALVATVEQDPAGLWGKISFLPKFNYVLELLIGPSRGILFTQPWIFLTLIVPFFLRSGSARFQHFFYFTFLSLFVLLWLNAGFPGWHGGGTPGPRYLAAALPICALFLPGIIDGSSRLLKIVAVLFVGISLVLRGLVYATWILPPPDPIWSYYWNAMKSPQEWTLFLLFTLVICGTTFAVWWRGRALLRNTHSGDFI